MKEQLRIKITRGIVGWDVLIESASHEVVFSAQSAARLAKLVGAEIEKSLKALKEPMNEADGDEYAEDFAREIIKGRRK
jgi:F0F1-type ATP synthase epsilon subunit